MGIKLRNRSKATSYLSYVLLCSEMIREPKNTTFLTALNFATDEDWENLCSGDLSVYGIAAQDFGLSTVRILEFLGQMLDEGSFSNDLAATIREDIGLETKLYEHKSRRSISHSVSTGAREFHCFIRYDDPEVRLVVYDNPDIVFDELVGKRCSG